MYNKDAKHWVSTTYRVVLKTNSDRNPPYRRNILRLYDLPAVLKNFEPKSIVQAQGTHPCRRKALRLYKPQATKTNSDHSPSWRRKILYLYKSLCNLPLVNKHLYIDREDKAKEREVLERVLGELVCGKKLTHNSGLFSL